MATRVGACPQYVGAGTLFSGTATGAQNVNIPVSNNGDLLLLVAEASATGTNGTIASLTAGWTQLGGAGNTYGGTQIARIAVGYLISAGTSGSTNVSVTFGGTGTLRFLARVYRFKAADGFDSTPVANTSTANTGTSTSVSFATVVPSGNNQLAVQAYGDSISLTTLVNATGETGGNWLEPYPVASGGPTEENKGTNGTLGIQISPQVTGATISGGSFACTSSNWVSLGFTLVPTASVTLVEGALPTYSSAGTLFSGQSTGAQNVNIPSSSAGDLLFLVALAKATNNDGAVGSLTAGWSQLGGASNVYPSSSQISKLAVGWLVSAGTDGTTNVSVTFGGTGTVAFLARVYRFTATNGFNATAVANLSFVNNTTGTSIFPTSVFPSGVNQLAVQIYANSVNTTVNASTGENGGDWTEPVAESIATTPAVGMIGIQVSDQSSGASVQDGSFAITSGNWVTLGVTLVPGTSSVDAASTPTVGAVAVTGFAPSILAVSSVTSSFGTAAVAGFVPVVTTPGSLTTIAGAAAISGSPIVWDEPWDDNTLWDDGKGWAEPGVSAGSTLAPAAGTVTAGGKLATISAGWTSATSTGSGATVLGYAPAFTAVVAMAPAAGAAAVSGQIPTIAALAAVSASLGTILINGFAPTVTAGAGLPTARGTVAVVGLTPTFAANAPLTSTTGSVASQGQTPAWIAITNVTLTPPAGTVSVTGQTATVTTTAALAPAVGACTVLGQPPAIAVQGSFSATPGAGAVAVSGQIPIVSAGITGATTFGAVSVAGVAPAFAANAPELPITGAIAVVGQPPSVSTSTDVSATPLVGAVTIQGQALGVVAVAATVTGVGAVAITGLLPSVTANATAAAVSGAVTVAGQAPTIAFTANSVIGIGLVTAAGKIPTVSGAAAVASATGAVAAVGLAPTGVFGATMATAAGAVVLTGQPPAWAGTGAVTAIPGTGAVVVGLSTPLVVTTTSEVFPTVGAAAIVGFAPSFSVRQDLQPDAGAVTILGSAPVVVSVFDVTVTTNVGAIAVAGFAPTALSLSGSTPASGAVTLLGRAPIVNARVFLTTGDARNITVQGFAPSFTGEVGTVSFPGVSALNVIGFKPIVGRRPIVASAVIDLGTAKVDPGPNSGIIDAGIISTLKDRAA